MVESEKPLGPTVGPGGLKVVDQVAREESFLGKVSRLANTSKSVAGADGGQLSEASNRLGCLFLDVEKHLRTSCDNLVMNFEEIKLPGWCIGR